LPPISLPGLQAGWRREDDTMKPVPENYLIAHTDGGARGNPGPAGYGVVIQDSKGNRVAGLSKYLGRQTNNVAEYQALIGALEYAIENRHRALKVVSDSELLVRQIKGIYKVKEPTLRDLHARASELISKLEWFQIEHVLRGHNREADQLANEAMDKGSGRPAFRTPQSPPQTPLQEFNGIVRSGKIELLDGSLPEGTPVQVRIKG
jgi:ribonuclease HI